MKQNTQQLEFGQGLIRRYMIIGERRFSNYWWAIFISIGSVGFLLTGIRSYFSFVSQSFSSLGSNEISYLLDGLTNISTEILTNQNLPFFPQGLLMTFYGSLGILVSIYWWFLIFWNVGGGFNEFNKKEGIIRIFRWGYPGKNRKIDFSYSLKEIDSIKVELKQGLDPQRTIYLKLKSNKQIPLTGIGQPLTLKDIEKQASELANFLQISLEGL
jgi:hypothetical protein